MAVLAHTLEVRAHPLFEVTADKLAVFIKFNYPQVQLPIFQNNKVQLVQIKGRFSPDDQDKWEALEEDATPDLRLLFEKMCADGHIAAGYYLIRS